MNAYPLVSQATVNALKREFAVRVDHVMRARSSCMQFAALDLPLACREVLRVSCMRVPYDASMSCMTVLHDASAEEDTPRCREMSVGASAYILFPTAGHEEKA